MTAKDRFIPAPAGNGSPQSKRHSPESVHPRACGEWFCARADARRVAGSSPRLRGMVSRIQPGKLPHRFIPAPAGNGQRSTSYMLAVTVHPRACGEWAGFISPLRRFSGSSPRLRGMAITAKARRSSARFIPAPAGNGDSYNDRRYGQPVHPRACGEWLIIKYKNRLFNGSSPRLRGMASAKEAGQNANRFIPAPAGNGAEIRKATEGTTVHPRACGEWFFTTGLPTTTYGSSPRLRGMATWQR